MTDKQKKWLIFGGLGVVILYVIIRFFLKKDQIMSIIEDNITPDQKDTGGILSPMNYNIPPINMGDSGPTEYGGLTFISAPASAFACGQNTYYTSPEAFANSPQGKSATNVAEKSVFDLIDWNV